MRASQERDHACEQLFGRKRHGQDVVDAGLEGSQFVSEITPTGQADHWQPSACRPLVEERYDLRSVEVHVENEQVRLPRGDLGLDLGGDRDDTRGTDAVIEGQRVELGNHAPLEHQEHARLAHGWPAGGQLITDGE